MFIPIKDAQTQLADLARRVEKGETIVVTQDGKPVLDLVKHQSVDIPRDGGLDLEAGWAFLTSKGLQDPFPYIANDFDEPLPEDFLIKPLPPESK